jgi:Flp pilus assembly protein TadD
MLKSRGLLVVELLFLGLFFASIQAGASFVDQEKWKQGKLLLAEGKPKEAKEAFEGLLREYPKEPDVHLFLAITCLRMRETQEAEVHIQHALVLDPDHVEARTLLGWVQLEIHRDYGAAVKDYSRVVQLKPQFPEAHNNLGVALRRKGELERAVASFNQALKLRPNYAEALSNLGWTHIQQGRWREARAEFEAALKIDPRHEGSLYGLAQVLRESRDYAAAQDLLRKLTAQSPNFVYWLERGELQLIRYYWVLILIAGAFVLKARYQRNSGRISDGG